MQFLRHSSFSLFLNLLAFTLYFSCIKPIQAQEDPGLALSTHASKIERSDTDPTYIMDDSVQRRQFQAKVNEERRQAKKQAQLEALQAKACKEDKTLKKENLEEPEATLEEASQ